MENGLSFCEWRFAVKKLLLPLDMLTIAANRKHITLADQEEPLTERSDLNVLLLGQESIDQSIYGSQMDQSKNTSGNNLYMRQQINHTIPLRYG